MVFQQFNLVTRLSVMMNVLSGRLSYRSTWRSLFYSFTREDRAIALECLEMVALGHKAFQRADTLSGGEQQRVAIARALAQRPKLILADEPVASLDPKIARQVLDYLKDISQRLGISVICNLHQIDFAREYAERIVGLSQGKLIFDGPPSALTDDILEQIYGLSNGEVRLTSHFAAAVDQGLAREAAWRHRRMAIRMVCRRRPCCDPLAQRRADQPQPDQCHPRRPQHGRFLQPHGAAAISLSESPGRADDRDRSDRGLGHGDRRRCVGAAGVAGGP